MEKLVGGDVGSTGGVGGDGRCRGEDVVACLVLDGGRAPLIGTGDVGALGVADGVRDATDLLRSRRRFRRRRCRRVSAAN